MRYAYLSCLVLVCLALFITPVLSSPKSGLIIYSSSSDTLCSIDAAGRNKRMIGVFKNLSGIEAIHQSKQLLVRCTGARVSDRDILRVASFNGKERRVIHIGGGYLLSPDGSHIAWPEGVRLKLWSMHTTNIQIIPMPGRIVDFRWGPTGKKLLVLVKQTGFSLNCSLYLLDLYGAMKAMPTGVVQAEFSPDGKWILYSHKEKDLKLTLWKLLLSPTAKARRICSLPADKLLTSFQISPDNRSVLLIYDTIAETSGYSPFTCVDSNSLKTISIAAGKRIAFSPDGKYIAYISGTERTLCCTDLSGQQQKIIDEHCSAGYSWTPNGDILFYREQTNNLPAGLYNVHSDGSSLKFITKTGADPLFIWIADR